MGLQALVEDTRPQTYHPDAVTDMLMALLRLLRGQPHPMTEAQEYAACVLVDAELGCWQCGGLVEYQGWLRYCSACQAEMGCAPIGDPLIWDRAQREAVWSQILYTVFEQAGTGEESREGEVLMQVMARNPVIEQDQRMYALVATLILPALAGRVTRHMLHRQLTRIGNNLHNVNDYHGVRAFARVWERYLPDEPFPW